MIPNQALHPHPTAVLPTTIIECPRLAEYLRVNIFLASETFQHTGSFKFRAAYQVATRRPESRVIAASSGNFGQALAHACQLAGKTCVIVMPSTSAQVKVDAVRHFGGVVDLLDVRSKTRQERVRELAAADPEAYVASAYDDPLVIAGNATLGEELGRLQRPFDCVITPIGGGGLASGIIEGLRRVNRIMPVFGVEPVLANDAAQSLRAGHIVAHAAEPQTVADGVRSLSVGRLNWPILRDGLRGVVEVSEDQIREAVRLLFLLANVKAEPTGALAIAALLADSRRFESATVCCVISGGNVDPPAFCEIIQAPGSSASSVRAGLVPARRDTDGDYRSA